MKKTVKQINEELKALYANREQSYLEEDDKKILRYEKQAIEFSERYKNDPEFKKVIQDGFAKRDDEWLKKVTKNAKALAENHKDPEWKANWEEHYYESRERLKADPEFKKMMDKRNKEMAKDPEWYKALLESRAPISDKNSDWYKRIKKANQKKAAKYKDPTTKEYKNFKAGREKMKANPVWRKNMLEANGAKACQTPWGKFDTAREASKATKDFEPEWKPICVPWGEFTTINNASRHKGNKEKLRSIVISNKIKNKEKGYYKKPEETEHLCFYSAKKVSIRCDKKAKGFKWL
jgi:hypothetical protein